jgi:P4 family phage/plasmid primase-like protien
MSRTVAPPHSVTLLHPDVETIGAFWDAIAQYRHEAVWEVRGPKTKKKGPRRFFGTVSGYFNDRTAFIAAIEGITGEDVEALYLTLNPVKSDLFARAANRIKDATTETTSDGDILRRTTILIDCDPVRSSGISSTDDERDKALALRDAIHAYLTDEVGWPPPLASTMSGNGGGLLYRIDLPNDTASTTLVERVLKGLATAFSTTEVTVDTSNVNAARITKIVGTIPAKGDNVPERPWRMATGIITPDALPVAREMLERVGALAPPDTRPASHASGNGHGTPTWNLREILEQAGIGYREKEKPGYRILQLDKCLTSTDHADGAALFEFDSGAVGYRCLHNRCSEKRWADVREVLGLGKASEKTTADAAPVGAGVPRREHQTDLGNSRRLVARHGDRFRWCKPWGEFVVWDGERWVRDEGGQVMQLGKKTPGAMYAEAADLTDDGQRKALAAHALRSESEPRLRAMVNLAKSEPGIPITPEAFDQDSWLFNVRNGTLDLRTGVLRAHRREDFLTKLAPVTYIPDAVATTWEAFLERIFSMDTEMIRFVQRVVGYCLTGQTSEQCLFVNYGRGANGKTTLTRTIVDLLGDYAQWTPTQTLLAKRGEAIENDLARLRGARFVAAVETDGGRRLAEALVKQLTGGDKIAARFLYGEYFEFLPTFKLWLATNHRPEIKGTDHAIWRRIRLIPFNVTIPEAEWDRNLAEKLRAEFPGILRWAIEGCLAWQRDGLGLPDPVKQATSEYRATMDVIGAFLVECCEEDPEGIAGATDLYTAYVAWCEQSREHPETQRRFGDALSERGYGLDRHPVTRRKIRRGLGLVPKQSEQT